MINENFENPDLVDYTSQAFKKNYEMDGMKLYAIFAQELYEDDEGLDGTGRYCVLLLHSTGLLHFYMVMKDGNAWEIDEEDGSMSARLGVDLVQWLGDKIDAKTA